MNLEKIWHVLITPGTELAKEGITKKFWWLVNEVLDPAAIIITIILLFLVMLGSKRAGKGVYWVVSIYAVFKVVTSLL